MEFILSFWSLKYENTEKKADKIREKKKKEKVFSILEIAELASSRKF